ncbi:MAG: hypothetical protein R3344_14345, partial [Acidobacteriota bacterium]|nr:hypothetical protein [Acidobacteriota bacterium]
MPTHLNCAGTHAMGAVLAGTLLLGGCARPDDDPTPADLILTGGTIAIVDDDFSLVQTLVVTDGQ